MAVVVVPVHNGESHILPLAESLAELRIPITLLFVDDGSRDESWLRIREACNGAPAPLAVRGIRLDENRGQQAALLAGLAVCRDEGPVVTMDDDLSHPVSLVPGLLEALADGTELAYADPPIRPGTPLRRLASRLHQYHLALLTGSSPKLRAGSYRAMSSALVRKILDSPPCWPYISAMALGLRPRPRWTMVPSPEWKEGASGRFSPGKLLLLEFRLFRYHGPWARAARKSRRRCKKETAATAGETAAGWIAEIAGPAAGGDKA